jgi:hypothetical protein
MIHEIVNSVVEVVISREIIILALDVAAQVFSGAFKVMHFPVIVIG